MKLLSERFRPNGSIIETFKVDYSEGFCFFVFPFLQRKGWELKEENDGLMWALFSQDSRLL